MMNKALRIWAMALVAVLFTGQVQAQDYKKIDLLTLQEKYDEAMALCKSAQAEDPKDEEIDYRIGKIHFLKENYGAALQSFDLGVKHASRKPINYVGQGSVAVKNKNFDLAKEKLDRALEVDKAKSANTMLMMAAAYLGWEGKVLDGAKYFKEAEALLLQVTTKDPENPAGFTELGNLYYKKGILELAKTYYERAIGMDDQFIDGHYRLGIILKKEEKYNEAAAEFKKCLALNAEYAPALIEMAEMYYGIRQYDKGLDYMNQYLKLMGEDDKNAIKRKGIFLYLGEKYEEAIEVFESVKGQVDDPVVYRLLGYSYVRQATPAPQKALDNLDIFLGKVKPKFILPMDYQMMGTAKGQMGDMEGLVAEYMKAVKMVEDEGESPNDLYYDLAGRFKDLKDYANQAKYLEMFLANQSRFNLKETFNLGRAYYNGQDWANADSTFGKMVIERPKLYLGYLWQGRVRDKQDEKSANGLALGSYEKVREIISETEETVTKYKKDYLESLKYLGAYHTLVTKDYAAAAPHWEEILRLLPEDGGATEGLKFCKAQLEKKG